MKRSALTKRISGLPTMAQQQETAGMAEAMAALERARPEVGDRPPFTHDELVEMEERTATNAPPERFRAPLVRFWRRTLGLPLDGPLATAPRSSGEGANPRSGGRS